MCLSSGGNTKDVTISPSHRHGVMEQRKQIMAFQLSDNPSLYRAWSPCILVVFSHTTHRLFFHPSTSQTWRQVHT